MRLILALLCTVPLMAAVSSTDVVYADGDVALTGTLCRPAAGVGAGAAAGVVVFPEWWGCNAYAKRRAAELAEHGYVAFAADMYGTGKVTTDPKQAGEWAGAFYKDPALLLRRAGAALTQLRKAEGVDAKRTAAVGFCFGGMVSLQLARTGTDLRGVVSYHGSLGGAVPAAPGAITATILVLHGGADPLVPAKDVAGFIDEMTAAKATWRMEIFGGALHAFTNPDADKLRATLPAVGYDADAERRAFLASNAFLAQVLK